MSGAPSSDRPRDEPIAIIGLGLRLPGAETLDEFWEHLAAGRSLITEVSPRRWDAGALKGAPGKENKTNSIWGGFLEDADCFDAAFFNISPREASWMDPQQRFALELAWKAIEDAGIRASSLSGSRTGVYMGVCHWDYAELLEKHLTQVDAYTPTGIAFSIIANRVSHFFDLCGPSIANDTACAASMTSVYEACRALGAGECDLALAGGVNLCWSPNHFIAFSKSGMLSRDGRSKAFDERADGYVRGEGGAMLLLKPLARARADGDPIHAIIRGIGTNHGGRTNSLTATNPKAQAALIAEVYRAAGVTPDTVSYIEAHGTGTPLGDPIEIAGLKEAFRTLSAESGILPLPASCGVGSVKTNIGHLEGAAGVAGIVKVVAAMRHETLPANVDFVELNSLIDLASSPFRIQSEATPWPRIAGQPRRAGVSSFGFGGSNAHVLLEDDAEAAVPQRREEPDPGQPVFFPLSAKNEDRLRAYASELLRFLDRPAAGCSFRDLAHTFGAGREEMPARVAFVVSDRDALRVALQAFLAGASDPGLCLPGVLLPDENTPEPWPTARRWANGEDVGFGRADADVRRIHAPTYPFGRERYWMDESLGGKDAEGVPHPLLHRNISRFGIQFYRSHFKGAEFFWAGHHVNGTQVLPGMVYLEMARAAFVQATGPVGTSTPTVRFENVTWTKPIAADVRPVPVEIRLTPQGRDRADFTIGSPESSAAVNAKGAIEHSSGSERLPAHDIAALRARASTVIEPEQCYERLRASGVAHGPMFRAIAQLCRGSDFVLASLKLPRLLQATQESFPLHPILLDAAIQAWVGLTDEAPTGAAVPFACREILVDGACDAAMWAYVRLAEAIRPGSGVVTLHIDLCDRQGRVRVAFRELVLRVVAAATEKDASRATEREIVATDNSAALVFASSQWQACPVRCDLAGGDGDTVVFLAGLAPGLAVELAAKTGLPVSSLAAFPASGPAATITAWFRTLHVCLSDLIRTKPKRRQQLLVLCHAGQTAAAAAALIKTAEAEHPKIFGAAVCVEGPSDIDRLARIIAAEQYRSDRVCELRYTADDVRMAWRPFASEPPPAIDPPAVTADGTYWITGGAGGLGLIFAQALAARGATRIILSGRRPAADPPVRESMERLRASGHDVRYAPCDVAEPADVARLVDSIAGNGGGLRGVIHCAGVLDDGYIFGTDPERIDPVFAPKVAGALNIDAATHGLALDFFVLCSSVAAVFGNPGQAAYAGANAFLGAFAEYRAAQVARGERRGATLAIAWPLWENGGMTVDAPFRAALRNRFGTTALPTDVGVSALARMLDARCTGRWTILHGDRDRIGGLLRDFGKVESLPDTPAEMEELPIDRDLPARATAFLKDLLGSAIQMDPAQIKANRPLAEYGLDSIVIVELTDRLEQMLGPVSKTMFFEHVDLAGVAGHLVEEHRAPLALALAASAARSDASSGAAPNDTRVIPSADPPPAGERVASATTGDRPVIRADDTSVRHDIAIVGLSLRVAKAADKNAFWEMLAKGLHGFEPYPASRWNHEAILHPERDVLGKTVVRTGAFLDGVDEFDPRYFRISQYEAELMSPEVRLLLQASVEAFEDAGYSREYMQRRFGGDVAVIVGSMTNEYDLFGFQNMLMRGALASGSYTGTMPNMVSYFYGFTGPSYFLDTMCSASSTCVHEAVHMLRAGRCRMALAGGVSLLLHPQKLIATSQEHFTTKTAEVIRGYGLGADGTILGEGVGALVLKTLADAERDGDHIYGVIKGSGISNAGVRNGFTVPNPLQQAVAIERALEDGGIDPRTIGYIEGHGSGTALGDPIEIKALTLAFRKYTKDVQFCPIGTAKSNIAHLLGASGLAGIAKVLMQLAHGQLAPSLHAEPLNPNIPFGTTPFYVQRELAAWPRLRDQANQALPRRAGITSIGAGGMNSHIIVEEHIPREAARASAPPAGAELLVFSAMSEPTLVTWLTRLRRHLADHPDLALADLAYTLQVGRNELPCRLACVCADTDDVVRILSAFIAAPGPVVGAFYTASILDKDPHADAAQVAADTKGRVLAQVAAHWTDGTSIDWDAMHAGRQPRRLSLPAYPFERVRCWYPEYADAPSVVRPIGARSKLHPFVGVNRSSLDGLRYVTPIHLVELLDYVYTENRAQAVLPTVVVEIMAALGRIAGLAGSIGLRDLRVWRAMAWRDVAELTCMVERAEPHGGGLRVTIEAADATGDPQPFASGWVSADDPAPPAAPIALDLLRQQAVRVLDHVAVYDSLGRAGLRFKPYLEVVERAYVQADGGILCDIRQNPPQQDLFKQNIQLPPGLLGAAFQALVLERPDAATLRVAAVEAVRLTAGEATHVLTRPGSRTDLFDILFLGDTGATIAALRGLALRSATELASGAEPMPAWRQAAAVISETAAPPQTGDSISSQRLRAEFLGMAGNLLKFSPESLSPRASFYDLGFDSVSLTHFAAAIGDGYGISLSPAIFFEQENIDALCAHLIERYGIKPRLPDNAGPAEVPVARGHAFAAAGVAVPADVAAPQAAPSARDGRIAIIGLAARLPGSDSAEEFFDHLLAGRDLVTDFPIGRYGAAYRARIQDAGFPKRGGFLTDVDRFDAAFFKTTPVEAERMDPQQRLMLETVWRALENAGYRPDELPANTGVFVGVTGHDYASLLQAHGVPHDGFAATGNSLAMVANRISYHLDVHGPSEPVDTACSSSLVALLRAADAIRSGACDAALAGGVNLTLSLEGFEGPHQAGMLSPDGRCKTFSRAADGYVRGEGVAAVLLKPLRVAERDGDAICGVLIGGAENHGGRAGSLTAPNAKAQADLVLRAMAGIDPASIGYIETHGTGTSLGDPVEVNGLRLAYGKLMGGAVTREPFIGLGSAKSNIGHLEAAAGLAGVVKVLMAMRRGELPASLHCAEINPHIELDDGPFYLVRQRTAWPRRRDRADRELPRRAAVSSFGFGGTNAHVVLEEYPPERAVPRRRPLRARTFADTRYWIPGMRGADRATGIASENDLVLQTPSWVAAAGPSTATPPAGSRARIVVACEIGVSERPSETPIALIVRIDATSGDISMRYREAAGVLLDTLRREIRSTRTDPVLVQLVVPLGDERELFEGLGAMLDSASAECPRIIGQVVGVPGRLAPGDVAKILADEARAPNDRRIRHHDGRRFVRVWSDLPGRLDPAATEGPRWRDGGIYLIVGGMGALGRLIAHDIATRASSAVLVLVGTSPLDADRAAFLEKLGAMGARADYVQADVASAADIAAAVRETVDRHGGLHGVVHCAGVIRDGYVLNKTRADLDAVLAPKVTGTAALARACQGQALDFLVLFSSLAGAVGNAGQADYAAANGFMDAFAAQQGATVVAVNWPLWRDGGMRVDTETEAAFFRQMGQRPLSLASGLSALGTALACGARQLAVVEGEGGTIRKFFARASRHDGIQAGADHSAPWGADSRDDDLRGLVDRCVEALRRVFGRISGLPAERIEAQASLDEYGIDSLMITRMNRELGDAFGAISKTLLFEHRSLNELARYLARQHTEACRRWVGAGDARAPALRAPPNAASARSTAATSRAAAPAGAEPIAVIGLSGRYPGAPDLAQFWANLVAGKDLIREVSAERWPLDGFFHPDPSEAVARQMSYSKWGGFLEGFADFDPLFFKIAPRDAAAMDPQERLFLMAAWTACEDAGYTRQRLAAQHDSRVGVFVGITKTGFALHAPYRAAGGGVVRPSTSFSGAANRVSHLLDLHGPSMPVDTMCSSSLTAIHEACEHLRSGDCELALAGGVNLYLHASTYVELSASRMLSQDGRCKSFGKGGNGFVPGEGVGCVLLKPLSRALADGDRIHALIRSTAVNHGGRTNGFTVPNPSAQRDLVRAALDRAGIDARTVTCIEAHGTGTELGDPIEVTGLTQAFRADTPDVGFCALGSVKSSIGHLEAAAGIAGLTKVILQMKHGVLAPTLHAAEINPNIDLSGSPFVLPSEPIAWDTPRRIAGVSSFGAGGANAHVVVEAWPSPEFADTMGSRVPAKESPRIAAVSTKIVPIPLSARDPDRLKAYAARLLACIEARRAPARREIAPVVEKSNDIEAMVAAKIADLLAVAPEQIERDEPFDAIGIAPPHRIALRAWAEATFDIELESAALRGAGSIQEVAAALAPIVAAADAGRDGPAPHGAAHEPFVELADLAYTLQVGREPMDARLGVEADSVEALAAGLRAYLDGRHDHPGLHVGRSQDHRDVMSALAADEADLRALTVRWIEQGSFGRLLGLWVKGWPVDWTSLHGATRPRIVTLPTYPFAQERYWVPGLGSRDDRDALAPIIEDVAGDADALLNEAEALEQALAPLIRSIVASVPPAAMTPQFGRWRQALDDLLVRFPGVLDNVTPAEAWSQWEAFNSSAPGGAEPSTQVVLAETMLRALPDILIGAQAATAVMFPAGSLHLIEGVYRQNAVAARFNGVVAAAVAAEVGRKLSQQPDARLRILEIGAGTGGTSEAVFRALAPYRSAIAEYRFTDVSRAFLIRAEREFGAAAPYLATALFDVEKPLAHQDIAPGRYDVVIAANVLHATADIRNTLAVVRATMASKALLLINETSKATLFTHVTFGLLAGWWRFVDADLRIPGTPSLTSQSWRVALEATELRWVAGSSESERRLGQQIIAAAADAELARPREVEAATAPIAHPAPGPMMMVGNDLRAIVRQAVAETLNIAPAAVGIDEPFADYGLDSILGAELVGKLRHALGIEIEQARLYDFATVARLEAFVADRFPAAVTALGERAAPVGSKGASPVPQPRNDDTREPIAIIGMSGRFAGSSNADELWAHLVAGHDLVVPATRFDLDRLYEDATPGSYGRHGSFLDGIDRFDSVFFGISGAEARYMDPQQRLFLEEAWKTLEHAGHAGADIEGRRCGVFVGCSSGDYQELFKTQPPGQAFWGNTSSLIPARIAYCLDLKGPAIAVDTACSSSLVALHLACQSLWGRETDFALAGGVFVQCTDRFYRYANQAGMLSPSGRCAAFGEGADGIVPGEAVAAVLLRPLSQALADGDTIHGLIVGSGTNQDGATNGITAPSSVSQERLIRTVYDDFKIAAADIGLVEAHGTGTPLGDPIEHDALARVFEAASDRRGFCALGSVKSNIGHATSAAGMAGLLKVLLALRHRVIPPTLHVGAGNPAIRVADGPFYLNGEARTWPATDGKPRRAAISSFGFSGTNAHVVIEEAIERRNVPATAPAYPVVLSARSSDQLRLQAERLVSHLADHAGFDCGDIACTLLLGRRHHHLRLAVAARDTADLVARLRAWLDGAEVADVFVGELDHKDRSEDAARIAAGNALIRRLRDDDVARGTAARPDQNEAYTMAVRGIAQAFVSGDALQFDVLFEPATRRRVPLPTTPFAPIRHWVDAPAVARPTPSSVSAAPASAARARPAAIVRLADVASASGPRSVSAANPPKVSLAPLANRHTVATSVLSRSPDADGIRRLELVAPWNPAVEEALARELAAAGGDDNVRAVLLSGTAGWSGGADTGARPGASAQAAVACAVPVVAAVSGSATGDALLLALHCDFVVLAEEGRYAATADLPPESMELLRLRLGDALAHDMLVAGRVRVGTDLRAEGLTLAITPAAQVETEALDLARSVAQAPRLALTALKRHLRQDGLPRLVRPAPDNILRAQAEHAPPGAHGQSAVPGRPIALASDVIELEVFADGVALVRMCERRNKNTFTDAFMAGMTEAFALIGSSSAIKVVVLTGHDGYFACGGALEGLESLWRGDTSFTDQKIYSLPLACPVPVIAAMQGHAIGAGWSLGMFCDLAVFGAESVYHNNYLNLGFTPGAGATLVVPERLGDDLGRETLFSARAYKGRDLAARAADLTVVPAAEVLPRAVAMAHGLAEWPREKLIDAKAQTSRHLSECLDATFARELAMHRATLVGNRDVAGRIRAAFATLPQAAETTAAATTPSGIDRSQRREQIRQDLVASLAEELMIGAGEIRDASGFVDIGLDSILAVTWIRRLNARFAIALPATAVYAHPTVGGLVDRVVALVAETPVATEPLRSVTASPPAAEPERKPDAARRARARRELVASLADELMIGPEEIRDASGFLELGLDSILAVTWIRRLNARLGIDLPATAVWAHPTVGTLLDRVTLLIPEAAAPAEAQIVPASLRRETAAPAAPKPAASADQAGRSRRTSAGPDAIAVIGAAGRFPKAPDLDTFWENIRTGRDCITEVPPERWDVARHYDPDPQKPGKSYCKWMGAADDVDLFDPHFFNITPREAELMDPQQRLFLQCAWHAIENAGIDPVRLAGAQCGVFVGSGPSGYADLIDERNAYSLLGSSGSILAARIAYLLDLHGPAISLDTACSSSLVAIAEACNSLLLGNSELALAGGASVLIGPSMFIDTSKVSMLSSDGRCFTFDHRANGFVPGEGVGVLLLKRLADAERDGDPIRAVIRGWGVNQDGKTNGITAPNPQAQTRLLRCIYERFGIDCTTIELVEAHGTGTPLGDPIEIEGLTGAFGGDSRRAACALGSVKSNVGHLLAAAGIAGAMKIMLALERHELPPTINFEKPNDHISLAGTPFYVNTARKDWPLPEAGPRRAAVSAFGFSGTNAHLVLEEYRRPARAQPVGNGPWIFPLSARTPEQLVEYAAALASFVAGRPDLDPADLAATFQSGRTPFAHRLAFIFRDRNELLATLDAIAGGRTSSGVYRTGPIRSGTGGPSGAPQSLDALARQWASGADIAWPIDTSSGRRIQAPGYPFARRRCWIEPPAAAVLPGDSPAGAKAPHAVEAKPRLHPLIGRAAADPDHDAFTATFRGDERDLSDLVAGDPLVGLFLPEMARAAGDLATQRTVLGLKHLVWGKPAPVNGEACELSVVLRSDAQGFLYDVVVNGNRSDPCHVGALILEGEDVAWPEPLGVEKLRAHGAAEDVTEAWRRFASADRGPRPDNPISQAADRAVLRVYRRDGEVLAHLRFPTDAAAPRGMSIDPLHLHALWRLMVFGDPDGLTAEPRYPYALERLLHAGPLPDELFVRLWWPGQEGRTREPAMAVVYDMKGKPRLMLDGLLTRRIDELPDLALVGT